MVYNKINDTWRFYEVTGGISSKNSQSSSEALDILTVTYISIISELLLMFICGW